jgi:hypothetical protein
VNAYLVAVLVRLDRLDRPAKDVAANEEPCQCQRVKESHFTTTPAARSHRRTLLLFPEILVESVLRAVRPVVDCQAEGVRLGHVDEIRRDANRVGRLGAPLPCPPAVRVGSVLRGSARNLCDLAAKLVRPRPHEDHEIGIHPEPGSLT